ncbi:HEAT-INDUCIBLE TRANSCRIPTION REPRESSOR-RELATED [Salix purpurea]|uniref:HEAT-INDUCIBLE TRANSCRIPTION REPRESSOR-RELATED n=1 Tax=Salix purpurea TaxID=77065 RepID=A0A9Q0WE95_SALPP|nr:HEAT-INDUCIBLE TRANSCRIPTION REPRESSOR-RELATED [Salix purpurea]
MAYRRRHGSTRASTFEEEIYLPPEHDRRHDNINKNSSNNDDTLLTTSSPSPSLAAQAIRASAAHREFTLSSAYAGGSISQRSKVFDAYEDKLRTNESKGFWGVLAQKAKAIIEEDKLSQPFETSARSRFQMPDTSADAQYSYRTPEGLRKMDNPTLRKGLDKITSSLNQIGDTFEKAYEEGRTIVENKTADIIQETRKLQIRRKGPEAQNQASRDVAMATAAKAKLLLRELKTVKADLAFSKQRCSQLEEENKILRESCEKGSIADDDDLIRLQLETLLAEKARLAHDNSVYARENRFLREIVEYHQLTMQDVVYLDEGSEEVTEVYPFPRMLSVSPPSPTSPSGATSPSEATLPSLSEKEIYPVPDLPPETREVSESDAPPSAGAPALKEVEEDAGRDAPPSAGMPVCKEKEEAKHKPANEEDEKLFSNT